jgi:hypothetical protein
MKYVNKILLLCLFFPAAVFAQMKAPHEWKDYETVFGVREGLRSYDYDVIPFYASAPANVFFPEDKIEFQFQLKNNTGDMIRTAARIHIIQYGTKGIPGNVWLPQVVKMEYEKQVPIQVAIPPQGYMDVPLVIDDITRYGGYAVVFDLGKYGRRPATAFVRSMTPSPVHMQYPKQALDDLGAEFLSRLGVQAIRHGLGYLPTTASGYRQMMQDFDQKMKTYHDNHITVLIMIGEGGSLMPLGTPRPHLDDQGFFLRTKQDYAWLPAMDSDFKQFVKEICLKYGYPRGPVTAVSLWNEPWEGISISGWQSDMLRYREIYTQMAEAVLEARKEGADVLVGGGDSNSNAWDKFFADGSLDMLPIFDFLSIHYQGMESPVLYPEWNQRHEGRVLIWDTESWVGNTDDRIGLVVAANRSAGYDRSMGIYGGYMYSGEKAVPYTRIQTGNGSRSVATVHSSWSAAAAMGATQKLIGEREFRELLFQNGLPWVMVFDGYGQNDDDGTIVVAGDLGEAFGHEQILFRNVKELATRRPVTGGKMRLEAQPAFRVYDFYGNTLEPKNRHYEIPLNAQGYFIRTNGQKGSFKRLLAAVRKAQIEGYEPIEIIAKDFTAPIDRQPEMELVITNILNRNIHGTLSVKIGNLTTQVSPALSLKANETQTVKVKVTGGESNPNNTYLLETVFDAGKDGAATHAEEIHVNWISRRSITIDGKLDDWQGAIPQIVKNPAEASISLTEAAWFPFLNPETGNNTPACPDLQGLTCAYFGYDDRYFYFAAKVADNTPHQGTLRFETRDDDAFFYPDTAYMQTIRAMHTVEAAKYLENSPTTQSIGIDIDLPPDKLTKTSLYFPNIAQHGFSITVYNRETGKELLTDRTDKLWDGVYVSLLLSGKIRIRCSAYGWWYTVKLGGVFFDASDLPTRGTTAQLLGKDFDTVEQWQGKYGNSGYWDVGSPAQFPADIACRTVNEDDFVALAWNEGVRRFTYRKRPVLPDGTSGQLFDNILLAFNVLPIGEDGMEANSKGVMPRYTGYKCTDYEYALNTVAPEYGGGFEIWRMLAPGMPRKHFYPRQGASPYDGAVKDGQLITVREGNTRYTECAIPWSELPDVKSALERKEKIKCSFRINDDGLPAACMELARGRSVSKKNSRAFHPDWKEHWANEVEFGFEDEGIYTLEKGDLSVRISANEGGKVVSLQRAGEELLVTQETHPRYYGAVCLPSPQERFWPPSPVLDHHPYRAERIHDTLRLVSKKDPLTGLRFRKEFFISEIDTAIVVNYSIENIADTMQQISAWDITRTRGGLSFFPPSETVLDNPASNLDHLSEEAGILWYAFSPDSTRRGQKLYAITREGWLAHRYKQLLFIKTFPPVSKQDLPPQQGEVEIYLSPDAGYIELENHSAYTCLKKGESLQYRQKWYLLSLPEAVLSDKEALKKISFVFIPQKK